MLLHPRDLKHQLVDCASSRRLHLVLRTFGGKLPDVPKKAAHPLNTRTDDGHLRLETVPPESPTLGFTHLQFEAILTAARESPSRYDFALVAMLGLGLRIFEATGADIGDLGEERGHRSLRSEATTPRSCSCRCRPPSDGASTARSGTRSTGPILLNSRRARMERHAATRDCGTWPAPQACGSAGRTRICSGTPSRPRCK